MKVIFLENPIEFILDPDAEDVSQDELIRKYEIFVEEFTSEKFSNCILKVATYVLESVNQQNEYEPVDEDLQNLQDDMILNRIIVYAESYMLFFAVENSFDGEEIVVQLDNEYEIEDIIIE